MEKRSLEDIQQEQEFMDWWEKECERVRIESEGINPGEVVGQGGRRGKRGGKGPKGRGGKNDGGEGNEDNGGGRRQGGGGGRGRLGGGRGKGKEAEQPKAPPVQGIVIR